MNWFPPGTRDWYDADALHSAKIAMIGCAIMAVISTVLIVAAMLTRFT